MHTLRVNVADEDYQTFLDFIESRESIEIVEDIEDIEDEFKIDVDMCLETLEKIKRGDRDGIKRVTPDELFKELGLIDIGTHDEVY